MSTAMFLESAGTPQHFGMSTVRPAQRGRMPEVSAQNLRRPGMAVIGSILFVMSVSVPSEQSSKIFEPLIGPVRAVDLALASWVTGPGIRSRNVMVEFAEED